MKKANLRRALAQYKDLGAQIDALEQQRAAVAARIKKAMGETEEIKLNAKSLCQTAKRLCAYPTLAVRGCKEGDATTLPIPQPLG